MAGRVSLINSVVMGQLSYSFQVYRWLVTLLKDLTSSIRNFLWSGSSKIVKLVVVSWRMYCKPKEDEGLGLQDLITLNSALLKKLSWSLMVDDSFVFKFLRGRFFSNGFSQRRFWKSSIWCGLRSHIQPIIEESICYWRSGFQLRVDSSTFVCLQISYEIRKTVIGDSPDSLTWRHFSSGVVTCADSYKFLAGSISKERWGSKLLFDNEFTSMHSAISFIWCAVVESNLTAKGSMRNSVEDLDILECLHVHLKPPNAPKFVEVYWRVPPVGWLKVNIDGAALVALV
ncbi:hypothetical protein PanWU01x14_264430 [Parasponia andersonii]|uniref:Uncharacterized protein n=1 Tax=Parasponia andersonii TaxID=3476 RepID=A0A2P5B7H5_PARAD|nr:hypothetical protein PanWU01x14_264430 [Parasponia andersonii]